MTDGKGAAPQTAPRHQDTNTDNDAGKGNFTSGDGAGDDVGAGLAFIEHLHEVGVRLFTAEPGGRREAVPNDEGELVEVILRQPNDPEFVRPKGWPKLTGAGNQARIAEFRYHNALCAICGKPVAVVDVDPRNGGDIEKVRALLARLKVRIFAEVTTPGGGKHFYVAGHEDLPSTSWKNGDELAAFPGVDIQSHGRNVFLPFTVRLKYPGKAYTVVFDDLLALGTEGDPEGAKALAQWAAEQKCKAARKCAGARHRDFAFRRSEPWGGRAPDARQRAYLKAVLARCVESVATAPGGTRNNTLNETAFVLGQFIAGAGLDQGLVVPRLIGAASACGLIDEDGMDSVKATIGSGLRAGMEFPRSVPDQRFAQRPRTGTRRPFVGSAASAARRTF